MVRTSETPSRILSPAEAPVPPLEVAPLGVPQSRRAVEAPSGARQFGEVTDMNGPPDNARMAEMGVDMELQEIGNSLEKAGKALADNNRRVSQAPPEEMIKPRKTRKPRASVEQMDVEFETEDEMTSVGIELPQGTYLCAYPIVIISHGSCIVLGYNPDVVKSPMFIPKKGFDLVLSIEGTSYKVTDIGARFKFGDNILQVLIIPPDEPVKPAEEDDE